MVPMLNWSRWVGVVVLVGAVGCADAPTAVPSTVADTASALDTTVETALPQGDASGTEVADTAPPTASDVATDTSATTAACPSGVICVTSLPFAHDGDTSLLPAGQLDNYSCQPDATESGPEQLYRVTLPQAALLSAAVYDDAATDVDVHLLSGPAAAQCLERGDHHVRKELAAGTYWIAVDTFASKGKAQAGKYHLDIGMYVPSAGPCAMQAGEMARVNDGGTHLKMPATGPIVLEAHLVTAEEPPPYPQSYTEKLAAHYALSQAKTGLVMFRDQVWAPKEGGGTFYGAGIFSPTTFPVLDEGWYVNMYWTAAARPKAGTKMILRYPGQPQAVVVSAGHETGPGNLAHIGGTPEESHFYLRTKHLAVLQLGIAVDQGLPLGPRRCE